MPSCLARAGALVVALLALLALGAVPASAHRPSEPRDLHILVTNDDGWIGPGGADTPLIVALRDALAAHGHDVTVVAPSTDQSGNGTRFTTAVPLTVANPEPKVWTVSGSPADSVFVGTSALLAEQPDLVVSGVALKDVVAGYVRDLVDKLASRRQDGPLLKPGTGLDINYPGAVPAQGAVRTTQDPNSYISFGYTNTTGAQGEPGVYVPALGAGTAEPAPGSDWAALRDGKISIQPIDADRTADPFGFGRLGGLFGGH